jgi:protease-4
VDELGGLSTAVGMAKKLAGIATEEEVKLVVWPKKLSFWQSFFEVPDFGIDLKSMAGLEKALRTARLMEKTRIWAVMPFWVKPS